MATADVYLPPDEDLTVPEVNLSSPALRAGSFHLGKYCESQNNVSMPKLMFFNHLYRLVTSSNIYLHPSYIFRSSCCADLNCQIHENVWKKVVQ